MKKVYVNEYNGDVYESVEDCVKAEEEFRIEREKAEAEKVRKAELDAKVERAYDKAYEALKEYIELLGENHGVDVDGLMVEMIADILFRKDEDDD